MAYEIRVLPTAGREILRLPKRIQLRVGEAIAGLADDPRPSNCRKLTGQASYYRIRVSDYRVLYEVRDREVLVLVVRVGHRRDVYR